MAETEDAVLNLVVLLFPIALVVVVEEDLLVCIRAEALPCCSGLFVPL